MTVNMGYVRLMPTARTSPIALDLTPVDACCPPGDSLLPRPEAETRAALFKALGDPVRLQLLDHIRNAPDGTACACHLPNALGISQPTLSHHLGKLVSAGLITREQRGRWAHYRIRDESLADAMEFLTAD